MDNGDTATVIARRRAFVARCPTYTEDQRRVALRAIDDVAYDLAAQMRFESINKPFDTGAWLESCGVVRHRPMRHQTA